MKSLERMIGLLDLFEDASLEWTMEQLHQRLGYTRSTLYRYVKVLTDAGLLASLPGGGYGLGPRIAELDYQMRSRDPLIAASRPVMAELVEAVFGVALLCRRYRDRVLCVHQEGGAGTLLPANERGRTRPLLQDAASRVVLAWLPAQNISRLHEENPDAFAAAGLGGSLSEVRSALKRIRQDGHEVSVEPGSPGSTSIAAPIFDRRQTILGSLGVSIGQVNLGRERIGFIADRVMFCARIISKANAREAVGHAARNPGGARVHGRTGPGTAGVPLVEARSGESRKAAASG